MQRAVLRQAAAAYPAAARGHLTRALQISESVLPSPIAVASAGYLILALSSPYSGVIRASPAPLEQVLLYAGQGQGAVGASR